MMLCTFRNAASLCYTASSWASFVVLWRGQSRLLASLMNSNKNSIHKNHDAEEELHSKFIQVVLFSYISWRVLNWNCIFYIENVYWFSCRHTDIE